MRAETERTTREVMASMRTFCDRMREMMDLIGDRKRLTLEEKSHLQQLLKAVKEDLRSECRRLATAKREGILTQIEEAYYEPAIRKAAAYLTPTTNSHPLKSKWFSHLYSVHLDINHLLRQLEGQFPDL